MRHGRGLGQRFYLALAATLCLSGAGCLSADKHTAHFHDRIPDSAVAPPPPGTVPTELSKITLPPYVIEPPDVLLVEVYLPPKEAGSAPLALYPQPISGQHIVRMDGTIGLGVYGALPVAGLTVNQAQESVRNFVFDKIKNDERIKDIAAPVTRADQLLVIVDVLAYNSKRYYVITDGAGYGEQIYPMTFTGNETVLDALGLIGGLPAVGSRRNIWIARRTPHADCPEQILPVDYIGLSQHGITATNYQILPGDRVYVRAEKVFRTDLWLQKYLSPVERILGVTLLGGTTVNTIGRPNASGSSVP